MKCLVTGATGFVGSNLALELDRIGWDVVASGVGGEQELIGFSGELIYEPFNKLNWDKIGNLDIVFHQAAIVGMLDREGLVLKNKDEFFKVNVDDSLRLFAKAKEHGCRKIVYASSTSVYGDLKPPFVEGREKPNSYYGESKKELDDIAMEYAKEKDIDIVGLRYCNIYGPRENHKGKSANMIYQLAQQMLEGNPIIFKYGEQKRDEIYIKDVVRANILASDNARESCILNCGTGKAVSFNEIISVLNNVLGLNRETEFIDNLYGFFQHHTECDISLAEKIIGFTPEYSIEQGISNYYDSGWLIKPRI